MSSASTLGPFVLIVGPAFEPEVKVRERRVELFHRVQDVVAPQVFGRKAVFDSKDLAYSFGPLQFTANSTSMGQVIHSFS